MVSGYRTLEEDQPVEFDISLGAKRALQRKEGHLADMGPFVGVTAPHTGRSINARQCRTGT